MNRQLGLLAILVCLIATHQVTSFLVGASTDDVRVRLEGGEGPWQGRLDVFYGGLWGSVCDRSFDDAAAQVVCKMLRYSPAKAKAHPSTTFGSTHSHRWLEVNCTGEETSLSQCDLHVTRSTCQYRSAGMDCFPPGDTGGPSNTPASARFPEMLLAQASSLTCDDKAFNVSVDTKKLQQLGFFNTVGRYNHVTLGTSTTACSGQQIGDSLFIHAEIVDCIPDVQETSSIIYYTAKLRLYHKEAAAITRDPVIEVEVECNLPRVLSVGGSYVIKDPHKLVSIQEFATFNTTMAFYKDPFFFHRITGWPLSVGLDQTLYVQLSVDSDDPHLSLRVVSCEAHDWENDDIYPLIVDRCPVDNSTIILPSGKDFARFQFSSFEFIGESPEVYISCNVTVCEPHDPIPNCREHWCWPGSRHQVVSKRASEPLRRHTRLSAGPLLITAANSVPRGLQLDVLPPKKSDDENQGAVNTPVLLVVMGAIVGKLVLVGTALYLRRRISGPVHVI